MSAFDRADRATSRDAVAARARRGPRAARRPHRRARAARRARASPTSSRAPTACSRAPRCATEVFAQLDPDGRRSTGSSTTATPSAPGTKVGEVARPAAVGAHRRAHRAQLPLPPLGRRHRDPPLRATPPATRPAILRHPQDAARPARAGEGRGARRWRREPPRLAVRLRAREGQPPRRHRHHRGGAARARAVAGPYRRGRVRPHRPGARKRSAPGASMVLLDNMTPDEVRDVRRARPRRGARRSSSRCRAASRSRTSAPTPTPAPTSSRPASITQSAPALDIGFDIAPDIAWQRRLTDAARHRLRQHPDRRRSLLATASSSTTGASPPIADARPTSSR